VARKRSQLPFLARAALAAALIISAPLAAQTSDVPPKAATCVACHGPNGNSTVGLFPILAGQTSRYLYLELRDFQAKRRNDPLMSPIAMTLTPDETAALATYFSQQKSTPTGFTPDPVRAARGEKKAADVLCTMCHLGGFSGQNEIPRVAGQQYDYIVKQLKDFKAKTRTNDGGSMTSVASGLSDDDILDLANYVAGIY
jgi:cytochrome c553